MTFATSTSGRRYDAGDVSLAGEVAQRAAVAVDNARLYRESEAARYDAEAASRAKGQFLAVMSHELRTPLNAILGYSELVEMGVHGPVSDAQREAMGRIRRSGQHLLSLVNNVLNLERSEANGLETEFATLQVAQLFEDASTLTRPQAEAKGIAVGRDSAARAERTRRAGQGEPGAGEPVVECGEVHALGWSDRRGLRGKRRRGDASRVGFGAGDSGGLVEPDLRAVRAAGQRPNEAGGGRGAGAGDQPAAGAAHGRRPHGRE